MVLLLPSTVYHGHIDIVVRSVGANSRISTALPGAESASTETRAGSRRNMATARPRTARRRKKETFSRWDAADYLKSEADMVAYLEACLEEAPDDAALLAKALGDIARARGMVQLAKDTGLTREGLYKALSKDGNPRLGTVLKVMRALGLKFTAQAA